MAKFIELNDAAKLLNVTADELKAMRQRGEIAGVSTGTSWKFKQEEIDRVIADRGDDSSSSAMFSDEFDQLIPESALDDDGSGDQDSASILVSDESLGKSAETTSSTIIGKNRKPETSNSDSDIRLTGGDSHIHAGSSDLAMASMDSLVLSGREFELKKTGSGTGDLSPDAAAAASGLGHDALSLDDDALSLSEDDDLVLGGSDVTLNPNGSGINLASPDGSGISLEEPLELGGSHADSLELPEDEMISLGDASDDDLDRATQLKTDDEFNLSPMIDDLSDESSDSGSQVIALVDSGSGQFDEEAATQLGMHEAPLLSEDSGETVGAQLGIMGGQVGQMVQPAQATQYIPVPIPDVPYNVWNVLGLLCVFMIMTVSGMLMIDLLRNMWAFDGTTSVTSSVMDGIISALRLQ